VSEEAPFSAGPQPGVPGPSLALPLGRLSGRRAFQEAVRTAFACAANQGWSEIVLCDANFADWPLGERSVVESLQRWARQGRRMRVMAFDYHALLSLHPRFVQWRGVWDHLLDCRLVRGSDAAACPSVLWSAAWVMQRIDAERDVLVCDDDASRRKQMRLILDESYRHSAPGFDQDGAYCVVH
jgi:hypothetical protein